MSDLRGTDLDTSAWWPYVEALMHNKGITANKLARELDNHASLIGQWKHEGRVPRPETARKIAHYFQRPVTEVFFFAGFATAEELAVTTTVSAPLATVRALRNDDLIAELKSRLIPDSERIGAAPADPDASPEDVSEEPKATPVRRKAPGRR
ncbi:helix-turn-helix domain-containing protein [Nocardia brasiliensis]|uniref:helix-turn-helix domain-containing protein n=1 Tax=Nocardia brasiliensis TaxID=37326 RepID=UPI002457CD8E|nr:helix-turn-helix transcriptional regulator [Nocardia brasiliensis]